MPFAPVERRRLYVEVVEQIERSIRDGSLASGDALPSERQLMASFAVGRPAIREALLSLQQKGLISIVNGERPRVAHPDAKNIIESLSSSAAIYISKPNGMQDFQSARKIFEVGLTREVARLAGKSDIGRIETALATGARLLDDEQAFGEADVDFHRQIVMTIGNPLITGLHQALSQWLFEQRTVSLRSPGAAPSAQAFHERIFEAIKAHDPDAAEAAMRDHLDAVSDYYWASAPEEKGNKPQSADQ